MKAMIIGNAIAGRFEALDPALLAALPKLELLVVTDFYADTPLGQTGARRPAHGDVDGEGRDVHII